MPNANGGMEPTAHRCSYSCSILGLLVQGLDQCDDIRAKPTLAHYLPQGCVLHSVKCLAKIDENVIDGSLMVTVMLCKCTDVEYLIHSTTACSKPSLFLTQ